MEIDGHEVRVDLTKRGVVLDIEEMDPEGSNWLVLTMTPAEALDLSILVLSKTAEQIRLSL